MQAQIVVFSAPKQGYAPGEWEDGAAGGWIPGLRSGDPPRVRFAVADGATEAYESARWVEQLIGSFMSPDQAGAASRPELERVSLSEWFRAMQERWQAAAPAAQDYIEELKIRQGTLATFVGGEILGLETPAPFWRAAALGDSVLFHVRGGNLVDQFPRMRSSDFASSPAGISSLPGRLDRMSDQVQLQWGRLAPGDTIFVATDAFAKWMITCLEKGDPTLWALLGELVHPDLFFQLVTAQRRAMAMKDDDVTLMRIRMLPQPVTSVVVCL
jgi:hypothetical protein